MDIKAFNHMLLHFYVVLLLLLLNNYVTFAYHDDTHNLAKRLDVDACTGMKSINFKLKFLLLIYLNKFLDNFNIHSSTIIRTEESKAMGAKFISDEEVASNDACMKLCCAVNDCDVFIFEEKVKRTFLVL
jgi:hypothetical protein